MGYVNIESPLFEIVSKTKLFDNCTIYLSQKIMEEFKLKDYYIKILNKINNSNRKYSEIYYIFSEINKLDYLKELNFNFNNIKIFDFKYKGNENINNESLNNRLNILNLFQIEELTLEENKSVLNIIANVDELKELDLSFNKISNIKLKKCEFYKLEELQFFKKGIDEINILGNVICKELKEINLIWNKLSDIDALENIKCDKLEKLFLSQNKISDILILDKVNFKELKELNLAWNNISNIEVLKNVKFDKLEILFLNNNEISDINVLKDVNFKNLKILGLSKKYIYSI